MISSEISYLKSMNIVVHHFMTAFASDFDRGKEPILSRSDFNRLFSNARAVRDVSLKLVEHIVNHFQ